MSPRRVLRGTSFSSVTQPHKQVLRSRANRALAQDDKLRSLFEQKVKR